MPLRATSSAPHATTITNLFDGVTAGSYALTFTAVKSTFGALFDPTAPVLETCTAHFFVTAR